MIPHVLKWVILIVVGGRATHAELDIGQSRWTNSGVTPTFSGPRLRSSPFEARHFQCHSHRRHPDDVDVDLSLSRFNASRQLPARVCFISCRSVFSGGRSLLNVKISLLRRSTCCSHFFLSITGTFLISSRISSRLLWGTGGGCVFSPSSPSC